MLEKGKQIYYKFLSHDLPLKKRLFNLIFSATLVVTVGGIIGSVLTGTSWFGILVMSLIALLILTCLVVANRRDAFEKCAAVIGVFVNLLLLPVVFFWSGGIESGMSVWFLAGLVYLFLMLEGKTFYVLTGLSVFSFSMCYLVSYYYPDSVHYLVNRSDRFVDTYIAMMLISIVLGILLKFQNRIYWEDRETIQKQQEELKRANETKSRFLANMSHEIRTPINTIIGLNEMNLREETSTEVEENCVNIQKAGKMLLALVNDVLDMSKIESGKMKIVARQYETSELFQELINFHWIRAHAKNLEFLVEIAPDIPSGLYGDDVRIQQVLANLITNAIKYTEKGSVTLRVSSRQVRLGYVQMEYEVSDTGIGIREEDIPKLFESFKRVDEKRNSSIEGTGLGLAITHQLIELMGGKLLVESVYQKGSSFTIQLEQRVVDMTPVGTLEHIVHQEERPAYHQSFEAPQARILVVDDNEMNRLVAVKLLRATKVKVDVAESGAKCLELTGKHFYHVIFMDHMMPEMDGIETMHRIRKQENGFCKTTPVVVLTANAISGFDKFYESKGFDGYLVKPIDSVLLEATILKFLPRELVTFLKSKMGEEALAHPAVAQRKKSVCVTTESISGLPKNRREEFGIGVIPYYIRTEYGRFQDEFEISGDNLAEYLGQGRKAEVEPPSVRDYETFFAEMLEHSVQIFHISEAVREAAGKNALKQAAERFETVTVWEADAKTGGIKWLTLLAAELAERGKTPEEIRSSLMAFQKQITTVVIDIPRNPAEKWEKEWKKTIKKQFDGKKKIDCRRIMVCYTDCPPEIYRQMVTEIEKYQQFDEVVKQQESAAAAGTCGRSEVRISYCKKAE